MHVEYSVICQHFFRHSGNFVLPILTILLVILALGHVLQWTLHITWQFMHEDEENSLSASVSCALMKHFSFREHLLSLFSVLFVNCACRALWLLFFVHVLINVDVVINYLKLWFVVLLSLMTSQVSIFLKIFFCFMGETKCYFKLSKCMCIYILYTDMYSCYTYYEY